MNLHEKTGIVDQLIEDEDIQASLRLERQSVTAELDALKAEPEPWDSDHAERAATLAGDLERIDHDLKVYAIDEAMTIAVLHPGA